MQRGMRDVEWGMGSAHAIPHSFARAITPPPHVQEAKDRKPKKATKTNNESMHRSWPMCASEAFMCVPCVRLCSGAGDYREWASE